MWCAKIFRLKRGINLIEEVGVSKGRYLAAVPLWHIFGVWHSFGRHCQRERIYVPETERVQHVDFLKNDPTVAAIDLREDKDLKMFQFREWFDQPHLWSKNNLYKKVCSYFIELNLNPGIGTDITNFKYLPM